MRIKDFVCKLSNNSFCYRVGKIIFFLLALIFFTCIQPPESEAMYNGLLEWENNANRAPTGLIDFLKMAIDFVTNCFIDSIILDFTQLRNTCIPNKIGQNVTDSYCSDASKDGYIGAANKSAAIGLAFIVGAIIVAIAVPFIGTAIVVLVLGAIIIRMIDACVNMYVIQPYEYMNVKMGATCQQDSSNNAYFIMQDQTKVPLTVSDVPFFYSCTEGEYGYMGNATSLQCASNNAQMQQALQYSKEVGVGTIIVKRVTKWFDRRDKCKADSDSEIKYTRDEIKKAVSPKSLDGMFGIDVKVGSFYRYSSAGYLQLCAVTLNTVLPVIVGCTYVPPPEEVLTTPDEIRYFTADTRCNYFLTGRQDLNALGQWIGGNTTSTTGGVTSYNSVALFLQSDLHLTSSVVGCIEDILIKVFIMPKDPTNSFLGNIQNNMRKLVFVILTLYICLLGIKIMSAPQVPQMGEWVMYVLKFALVVYFSVGDVWYQNSSITDGGKSSGLYATLLDAISSVADIFLQSTTSTDMSGMCYYDSGSGKNILSQMKYRGHVVVPTYNPDRATDYVQMTVWDLLDCKLINYLNFGSCKYSISGLMGLWFIGGAFWSGFQGLLLMLMTLLYIIPLFSIIFMFVHVVILSMFSITILVMVAPIMVSFALFEFTKQTFQSWMRNLLGYVLAPGILFAFIALMLATFDSIFYGFDQGKLTDMAQKCQQDPIGNAAICKQIQENSIVAACDGVTSVYCSLVSTNSSIWAKGGQAATVNQGTCQLLNGTIISNTTESFSIPLLGTFTVLKSTAISTFLPAITKMALFAVLFYFFSQSVIPFVSAIVGIQGLGEGAAGGISASTIANVAKTVASSGSNLAIDGIKKLMK